MPLQSKDSASLSAPLGPAGPSEPPNGLLAEAYNGGIWSQEDNEKLVALVARKQTEKDLTWEEISQHFPGRSGESSRVHYRDYLMGKEKRKEQSEQLKAALALMSFDSCTPTPSNERDPPSPRRVEKRAGEKWLPEENAKIMDLGASKKDFAGLTWEIISRMFPGSTAKGLQRQYGKLEREREQAHLAALALMEIGRSTSLPSEQIDLPLPPAPLESTGGQLGIQSSSDQDKEQE